MELKKGAPDYWLFIAIVFLLVIGLVMIFSASGYSLVISDEDSYYLFKRQLLWVGVGMVAMCVAMFYDYRNYRRQVRIIALATIGLLTLTLLLGVEVKGATRQVFLGGANFSPAEFAKLLLIIVIARGLAQKSEFERSSLMGVLPLLALGVGAAGLVILQPDMGTAVTIMGIVTVMVIAAGLNLKAMVVIFFSGALAATAAIMSSSYRMDRFLAFLDPWADTQVRGWQVVQSLYAIGSGGLTGQGLGQSMQKYLWLPERHTDFIFAILSEELGFIGVTFVIALFAILIWRGMRIALNSNDAFACLLATGITAWIGIQAIINMAMVAGKLPVTGITLPFISYGGSSIVSLLLGVGILLNISRFTADRTTTD